MCLVGLTVLVARQNLESPVLMREHLCLPLAIDRECYHAHVPVPVLAAAVLAEAAEADHQPYFRSYPASPLLPLQPQRLDLVPARAHPDCRSC